MKVYINYPNPHFTMHHDPACLEPRKHQKPDQRMVTVNSQNIGEVLSDFITNSYRFAANAESNDLLLDVSLSTPQHEESLVYILQEILSRNYTPFSGAPVISHC